jgi:hypothetical protein
MKKAFTCDAKLPTVTSQCNFTGSFFIYNVSLNSREFQMRGVHIFLCHIFQKGVTNFQISIAFWKSDFVSLQNPILG